MTFQKVKMLVYQSTLYLSSRDCSHSQSVIDHYSPKDYIQSTEARGSIGLVVQMVIVATCSIAHDASAAVVSWRADPPKAFHTPQPTQPLPLPGKRWQSMIIAPQRPYFHPKYISILESVGHKPCPVKRHCKVSHPCVSFKLDSSNMCHGFPKPQLNLNAVTPLV